MCEKSYVYKLNTKCPSLSTLFKKNNINHFEVVITLIFLIFLSRLIQTPITQKLQQGDKKISILFEAGEISFKITFLGSSVNP